MALWNRSILFAALTLPLVAQEPCERLSSLALPGVTITLAQSVPAGSFTPPAARAAVNVPAFCRVAGTITPEVRFELWMPAAKCGNVDGRAGRWRSERSRRNAL